MSSNASKLYDVYNLRTYFSVQPKDIHHCPACDGEIAVSSVPPTTAGLQFISDLIDSRHEFSRLYKCQSCQWWAIRESTFNIEASGADTDYLIVGKNHEQICPVSSQKSIHLEGLTYREVQPLPKELGMLFEGGEVIRPQSFITRTHQSIKTSIVTVGILAGLILVLGLIALLLGGIIIGATELILKAFGVNHDEWANLTLLSNLRQVSICLGSILSLLMPLFIAKARTSTPHRLIRRDQQCHNCGTKIPETSDLYCRSCGTKLFAKAR